MEDKILKSLENLIECAENDADKEELGKVMGDFESYCSKLESIEHSVDEGSEGQPITLSMLAVITLIRNLRVKITIMRFITDDNNLARLLQDEMDFLRVDYLEPVMKLIMTGADTLFGREDLKSIVNR